ncbi:MAG: methylenetetrahydrofolate reductase [bacterium]|nr:methylenetetrahydrofolate reductase [bacterium]
MLSHLHQLLSSGTFVVCAEMEPPRSATADEVRKKCGNYKTYVDAVNLTDNASANVMMSSLVTSAILVQEGLEPIYQLTCRDRNRLAMQSDLLGAAAVGIRNVLCLTGDHPRLGTQPEAKPVYDLDSVQLIELTNQLGQGKLMSGEEIKTPSQFFIGAVANPFATPEPLQLMKLEKKIRNGAKFIQTQSVFDLKKFDRWMHHIRERELHKQVYFLPGVLLVRSVKALFFMKEQVSGMSIPEELIRRMQTASEPKEEGKKICLEIIAALRNIEGIAGIHFMPVKAESQVPIVMEQAGFLPRPNIPMQSANG